MAQFDGKIFGIGFYKTGTTTLFEALRILGYHTTNGDKPGSYPAADDGATLIRQIDAGDFRLPTFAMFDAFTDNPYFRIWREIYALYPDARYILTVREEHAWIASCVRFYANRRIRPMRVWVFGEHANPAQDEESRLAWLAAYRSHNAAVREFFATRRRQFLEFDPASEPDWARLCAFLDAPIPARPWPHANPSKRDLPWRRAWRGVRRALRMEMANPPDE